LGEHRVLEGGRDLWLVVADAPLSRYGEASIQRGLHRLTWLSQCAVAHEAVVEYCLRMRAVVPMKLFTIFENDFRALAEIERKRPQLERSMARVADRREWGVRIRAVPGEVIRTAAIKKASTGASYLAAKKQARDAARELAERAQGRVNAALSTLTALSADVQRHPPLAAGSQTTRLLLDAAFLVANAGISPFRAATRQLARDLRRDGYAVEVTGPWPPYNFIEP
jgi:hypothetical protein